MKKDYTHFPPLLKTDEDKEDFMNWISFLQLEIIPKGTGILEDGYGKCCCLGTACYVTMSVENIEFDTTGSLAGSMICEYNQSKAPQWLHKINNDLRDRYGKSLVALNDGFKEVNQKPLSHPEIAEVLLEVYGHEL